MHQDLKIVIELQQIDDKIGELTARIDSLPAEIKSLEGGLNDFLHAHEERKRRLVANQKERKELEVEIQSIQARISRHRDQLYEVKTNEQYRAMLKEIEGEEENIRKVEDSLLDKMVEAETLQKLVAEAGARLDGEKARVAGEIKALESERDKDKAERGQLQARRQELVGGVSQEVCDLYERLRKGRNGIALVQVRDGLCTGCHVLLRPQAYNEVQTSENILTCESCGRILYYVEPPPQQGEPATA